MAVGRAKSPTVFLSGGLNDLPDQSTADGEGDCLRADISMPKGFHSVEETGPLMARHFYSRPVAGFQRQDRYSVLS